MPVRAHVDRHAVHEHRKVGAVVEVEAAQEILVGLAAAGMRGGDKSRHELEQVAGAQQAGQVFEDAIDRLCGATVEQA